MVRLEVDIVDLATAKRAAIVLDLGVDLLKVGVEPVGVGDAGALVCCASIVTEGWTVLFGLYPACRRRPCELHRRRRHTPQTDLEHSRDTKVDSEVEVLARSVEHDRAGLKHDIVEKNRRRADILWLR